MVYTGCLGHRVQAYERAFFSLMEEIYHSAPLAANVFHDHNHLGELFLANFVSHVFWELVSSLLGVGFA